MTNNPQETWKEQYFETVVPKMINVDHTPALDFISNLLEQAKREEREKIREKLDRMTFGISQVFIVGYDPESTSRGYGAAVEDIGRILAHPTLEDKETSVEK